jgi:hypothetical protein
MKPAAKAKGEKEKRSVRPDILWCDRSGYGYRWYQVGGLDYLLRRTDIDQTDTDGG